MQCRNVLYTMTTKLLNPLGPFEGNFSESHSKLGRFEKKNNAGNISSILYILIFLHASVIYCKRI